MTAIAFDHLRSEWEYPDDPVIGPAFDWANLALPETASRKPGIVVHYPGVASFPKSTYDSVRASDRWSRSKGYSIGYNAVLNGRDGDLWQARGDDYRCAANAGRNWSVNQNPYTIALQIVVAGAEPASPAAVARARLFVADCRAAAGVHLPVRPHRFYESPDGSNTACPGAGIIAQLESGAFEPTDGTPPPPEDYMIPTVVKTLDGPHLVQFSFRGPVYKMGQDADHDVTTAEVFGRGGGRAYVLGTGRIASYSTANPGSWAAEKAVMTEATARSRMRG